MTLCQAFYCTNEKGKCEKNLFLCNFRSGLPLSTHRPVTTKNNVKYDSIDDKKEKKSMYTHKMNYNWQLFILTDTHRITNSLDPDDHALLAQKVRLISTFSAACSVYLANQGYTNNYNYVWNFMGHILWPFNLILYVLFRTSFSNEAKVDKQKGPQDLSRSPHPSCIH